MARAATSTMRPCVISFALLAPYSYDAHHNNFDENCKDALGELNAYGSLHHAGTVSAMNVPTALAIRAQARSVGAQSPYRSAPFCGHADPTTTKAPGAEQSLKSPGGRSCTRRPRCSYAPNNSR